MNSNVFRMPARRLATIVAVTAVAAGPAALAGAVPAHATGDGDGTASAVVLRAGLDVSLLSKTVHVPLKASLNEVRAPQSAEKTALTVRLDGVDKGRPISVLRADVATAKATVDRHQAVGRTDLARAKVQVPGLPLLSLIEVEKVTSKAVCEAGKQPVAESNVLGAVTVLGKKVTLTAGGTTEVKVPGVGEVRLDLSKTETTSRTAAATALELKVALNPLNLNVAEVEGVITLAGATCASPAAPKTEPRTEPKPEQPVSDTKPDDTKPDDTEGSSDARPQSSAAPVEPTVEQQDLAATGGSSQTPYLAGGAVALVAAGGLFLARGRRRG
ncbi:SCO1860 family LAETG-anchored protein [Streptomyces apocyni]|uniref:SCO1860 family LAETG-anchored protein n=1 Tax=Streptomyces apocyni TaxID=2654677 RepID=UPI0018D14DC7|nr:SCO1860 family LAETG-anchored protein [Streptomyces apocyni]